MPIKKYKTLKKLAVDRDMTLSDLLITAFEGFLYMKNKIKFDNNPTFKGIINFASNGVTDEMSAFNYGFRMGWQTAWYEMRGCEHRTIGIESTLYLGKCKICKKQIV